MSTPMEDAQRETDRQSGCNDQRLLNRARFGARSLADQLWEIGMAGIRHDTAPDLQAVQQKRQAMKDSCSPFGALTD